MELYGLALGWVVYALLHSLLATLSAKHWVSIHWPDLARWYRAIYNFIAMLLLMPLAWASLTIPGDWLWRWTGFSYWLANGLTVAALAGLALSGSYDMGEFLGIRPLREKRRDAWEHEEFRISPLHRFVRHPWYALALVLVWTRNMNAPGLVSATAITLYLVIGSRLEERKLIRRFGAAYEEYRAKVPALIPLPWKRLSVEEATSLVECARSQPLHSIRPSRSMH